MPKTNRILFNILANDIEKSALFYQEIAGLVRIFTSDWYIVLTPEHAETVQLGIIDAAGEVVPKAARGTSAGGYITLVVENLDDALQAALSANAEVIEEPVTQFYGQTRALIRDPNGVIVDLSEPTKS